MNGSPTPGFRHTPAWFAVALVLVCAQAGLALRLFSPEATTPALCDTRPVVDGRHPLHLYHGSLASGTFHDECAVSCYDPAFQAGYPKTPVFDAGSRPAELFLFSVGGHFDPAAYKWGLFGCCLFVPLTFLAAGRGFGLRPAGACFAGILGIVFWWNEPVQTIFRAGQVDLLLAGLALLLFLGGLARYAQDPGPTAWMMLAFASLLGWYAHPVAWLGLLPVVAGYYLLNAPRHGLAWHLGFLGMFACGLAPNLGWLADWSRFWWLRQPIQEATSALPAWPVILGQPIDYLACTGPPIFGWGLALVGVGGLIQWMRVGRTGVVFLFMIAMLGTVFATRLGATWPAAQALGADRASVLIPALLGIPAAFALSELLKWKNLGSGLAVVLVAAVGIFGWLPNRIPPQYRWQPTPLALGLTPGQERLVQMLKQQTSPAARILIEESDPSKPGWNWTALLPQLTGRAFLGGLDPEANVELLACKMMDGKLLNRRFDDWPENGRATFCTRYNVGWVICRTPEAIAWWSAEPMAREIGRADDQGEVVLFELDRVHSYVRSGSAVVEQADRRRIVLRDLVPDEQGYVKLSFHFQRELQALPRVVTAEAEADPLDPIPLMKLKLPGPMSRVTLHWPHP